MEEEAAAAAVGEKMEVEEPAIWIWGVIREGRTQLEIEAENRIG